MMTIVFIGFFRSIELKIPLLFASPWDANEIFSRKKFFMENQLHFSVENVLCRSENPPENVCCKFCIVTVVFYTTIVKIAK